MLSFGVKKPHEFSAVSAFSPSACSPSESFPAPACAVPAFSAFADDADAPFSDEAAEAPLRSVGISTAAILYLTVTCYKLLLAGSLKSPIFHNLL
jgi:hypothetical protein